MKNIILDITQSIQIDPKHIQLALLVMILIMLVLSAGAPASGGGGLQADTANQVILLLAVIIGLLAGVVRARIGKRSYRTVHLRHIWLVVGAFIPQWLAFYLPATRNGIPDWLDPILLTLSLVLLLAFALLNINQPGFLILGLGLAMNVFVIISNGGLMPITPENAAQISTHSHPESYQPGSRFGYSKDIVLPREETRFWWLSDRFLSPRWSPYQFVFSLGDFFIAIGAFWLLWQGGGEKSTSVDT